MNERSTARSLIQKLAELDPTLTSEFGCNCVSISGYPYGNKYLTLNESYDKLCQVLILFWISFFFTEKLVHHLMPSLCQHKASYKDFDLCPVKELAQDSQKFHQYILFLQALENTDNYHEFCRLLARIKANYQLGEIIKTDGYKENMEMITKFTITSLRVSINSGLNPKRKIQVWRI